MLPYFHDMQHPEKTRLMRIANKLYMIERELEGKTHWSYIRYDNPLDNIEYQSSILSTIGVDLRDVEGDIEELNDDCVRSVLAVWYSSIYRTFFERWEENEKVASGTAD